MQIAGDSDDTHTAVDGSALCTQCDPGTVQSRSFKH
jgi:hypothetical protein